MPYHFTRCNLFLRVLITIQKGKYVSNLPTFFEENYVNLFLTSRISYFTFNLLQLFFLLNYSFPFLSDD